MSGVGALFDNAPPPMLITAFVQVRLKGNESLVMRLGP